MTKKGDATRRRILDAATSEFAAYGIAGARVDRIAEAAGSNKRMIYLHFGSKDALFAVVLESQVARAIEEVAFVPDDLESYAGAYFDFAQANPELMRLFTWYGLESTDAHAGRETAPEKLDGIAGAQARGLVSDRFSPAFILSTIAALGTAWIPSNAFAKTIDPTFEKNLALHRQAVVSLVRLMISS